MRASSAADGFTRWAIRGQECAHHYTRWRGGLFWAAEKSRHSYVDDAPGPLPSHAERRQLRVPIIAVVGGWTEHGWREVIMSQRGERIAGLLDAIHQHPLLGCGPWSLFDLGQDDIVPVVYDLVSSYPSLWGRRSQILIALEEARGNVARHAHEEDGGISFVRRERRDRKTLEFLFADTGSGFAIEGSFPPYSPEIVGREYAYRRTLDGVVSCRVMDPQTVEITFHENPDSCAAPNLEELAVGGMGLSIMSKVMDRVVYLAHVGPANLLWMQLCLADGAG